MKRYAIIVAGGKGTRMRNDIPKQFIEIAGKPILAHTIENFYRFDPNLDLIIVLPQNQQEYWKRLCTVHRITIPHLVVKGGETRFHSVLNGLSLIPDEGIVAIHVMSGMELPLAVMIMIPEPWANNNIMSQKKKAEPYPFFL